MPLLVGSELLRLLHGNQLYKWRKLCYTSTMNNKDYKRMLENFKDLELNKDYSPYIYCLEEVISTVVIGTFCGFKDLKSIHRWASNVRTRELLQNTFGIMKIPSYYWITKILKIVEPTSFNDCFIRWITSLCNEVISDKTVSFDGKTVCSTNNMKNFDNPLHIVSAQFAELGLTLGQVAVESKSNEIPAVQTLIKLLNLDGSLVVADALNCQRKTAELVIEQGGDYLFPVKENQKNLFTEIKNHIDNPEIRKRLLSVETTEKRSDRTEIRTVYVCHQIDFMNEKDKWSSLCCIGAIHKETITNDETSSEWHYFISSRKLGADDLLNFARKEWSVESMHWLLDVRFDEDKCRIRDANLQILMNMIRKMVINIMRNYINHTGSKVPFSNLMIDCLVDPSFILDMVKTRS